ncbi:MAG: hypothetical protein WAL63_06215 [Solirubrobacteraceae bacterium]
MDELRGQPPAARVAACAGEDVGHVGRLEDPVDDSPIEGELELAPGDERGDVERRPRRRRHRKAVADPHVADLEADGAVNPDAGQGRAAAAHEGQVHLLVGELRPDQAVERRRRQMAEHRAVRGEEGRGLGAERDGSGVADGEHGAVQRMKPTAANPARDRARADTGREQLPARDAAALGQGDRGDPLVRPPQKGRFGASTEQSDAACPAGPGVRAWPDTRRRRRDRLHRAARSWRHVSQSAAGSRGLPAEDSKFRRSRGEIGTLARSLA